MGPLRLLISPSNVILDCKYTAATNTLAYSIKMVNYRLKTVYNIGLYTIKVYVSQKLHLHGAFLPCDFNFVIAVSFTLSCIYIGDLSTLKR